MHELISRDEAQTKGLKRYFTGRECIRGHVSPRFVASGGCVDCVNRKTPKKVVNRRQHFFPDRGMFFGNCPAPDVTEKEAIAAFRYMELACWHESAIAALRADPDLMAKFSGTPEQFLEMLGAATRKRFGL